MQKQNKKTNLAVVLGVIFTLIALGAIVLILKLKSTADSAEQYASAGNTGPSLDTLEVLDASVVPEIDVTQAGTGFTPQEGLVKDMLVRGTVTDLNGFADLDNVEITVYRSDKMNLPSGGQLPTPCTLDSNDCYGATITSFEQTGSNTATFQVILAIENYADPTDAGSPNAGMNWKALAIVTDKSTDWGWSDADFEVNSLAAFTILPGTVNYGSLSLGANSSQKTVRFYNSGNRDVQSEVKVDAAMHSNLPGFADIPTSNVRFTHDDSVSFENATGVTTNDQTLMVCLPQQTQDGAPGIPSVPSYFTLQMPASGVNGIYQNVLTFTAEARPVCSGQPPVVNCVAHPDDPVCD